MRVVVVGGGVAGVCCVEELCRLCPDDSVVLVSAGTVLKGVSVVARLSRTLEELAVVERHLDELPYPNLRVMQDLAVGIDTAAQALLLASGQRLPYDKLCICAGARPKQLPPSVFQTRVTDPSLGECGAEAQRQQQSAAMQRRVLTIRDTDSVARLGAQLAHATRVAVVGNGGIALELIAGLPGVDVTWVMRHEHIGDAFFDLDAAQFLLEELQRQREQGQQRDQQNRGEQGQQQEQQLREQGQQPQPPVRQPGQAAAEDLAEAAPSQAEQASRASWQQPNGGASAQVLGHAVGPRWVQQLLPAAVAAGAGGHVTSMRQGRVELKYGCEVASIELAPQRDGEAEGTGRGSGGTGSSGRSPAMVLTLTSGERVLADLVLLAIGVSPALEWVPASLQRAPDGGLVLDRHMTSSDPAIFAAGDSASCCWAAGESAHWFQMRLWSQARAMGVYAAHCMAGLQDQLGSDMAFELFTHVTHFLGHKVVLLGLYNGQRLEGEPHGDLISYSRVTEGPQRTFVRVLLLRGRVQGVVLIGDTDLEETFENLILDQLDVSQYGPALLDPDFELDHVFD